MSCTSTRRIESKSVPQGSTRYQVPGTKYSYIPVYVICKPTTNPPHLMLYVLHDGVIIFICRYTCLINLLVIPVVPLTTVPAHIIIINEE